MPAPPPRNPDTRGGSPEASTPEDALSSHRTRTNTRTPLEPIGYGSDGAPLWPWQVLDGD